MSEPTRLVTADELERFPDDDYRYELVDGRLIRMSPVGYQHGVVVTRVAGLLDRHVQSRHLGAVVIEVGFTLANNPDTVRGPDIAFIRRDRIPTPAPTGFWKGPPDLAVEVLSPDDRASEVHGKIAQYLARGVKAVVVIDPGARSIGVSRRGEAVTLTRPEERLDLTDVIPGFRCGVAEVFPAIEPWEIQ